MIIQLVWLVFAVLVCGVLVWAIDQFPAIDPTFKTVAKVIIIAVLALYALYVIFSLVVGHLPAGTR